jgi:putative aldouronate transport system permease protein
VKKRESGWFRRDWRLYVMQILPVAFYLIFCYKPMIGLIIAFQKYNMFKGMWGSKWIGLENFRFVMNMPDFPVALRNTLWLNFIGLIAGFPVPIILAIMLCELGKRLRVKLFQASFLLPNLLSWVVIGLIAYAFLNADTGFVNNSILEKLGKSAVTWYSTPGPWPVILVLIYLWKNAGYMSIVYMAAISGIDKSLYESAALDGATKMQQIFRITLPLLKPTVITLTLMSVGRIFYSDFGLFYQVPQNSGALFNVTQTIDTYVYRGLMENNNIGMSAAAGLYQSVVGFILVLGANALVRRIDKDNALF